MTDPRPFGSEDASYQAAGGETGIRQLVNDFYDVMETLPEARTIRQMHPADLSVSRDKLASFLSGWLGGPRLFREKYGQIFLPQAHQHLPIGIAERDAWLKCMEVALARQPYTEAFRDYLLKALAVPAERCRTLSE